MKKVVFGLVFLIAGCANNTSVENENYFTPRAEINTGKPLHQQTNNWWQKRRNVKEKL